VRRGMEGVFQVNFGHVRIHADPEADALNRGVAAIAFTVGSDIFFRAGAYQPHTVAGQHLLAHELTHVVQQRTGSLAPSSGNTGGGTMTVGAADDRHEQEAEATAHRVTAALQRRALLAQATTPGAGLARQHDPTMTLTPAAPGVRRVPLPGQDPPVFPVSFPAIVYYPGGANIHTHPAVGSPVVALLPSLTTRVMVTGKTTTSNQAGGTPDWYRVRVSAGPHAGKVGFLQSFRVDSRWPTGDPAPTLYVIQPGDTALGLAARFYGLQGSAHPETNADLRRYVEVLVRVNQRNAYWIEHGNDGDPLNWMRAQVRATYAMWVPSRAWAGKAAGAVPNPSLTGGAWATVHQQLQAHGWGEVNILQAVSLFAQDVAVVGDKAVGALRHAVVIGGTLVGELGADAARTVLPVLEGLASAAVAPAVVMARLGVFLTKTLAKVPGALLDLLTRKAHELLASLLGEKVLARLGGAVAAILKDPGTFIGNLGAALGAAVGHLVDHVENHFGEDALSWLVGKAGADIPVPRSLALTDVLPTIQAMLGLTRSHMRDLVVQQLMKARHISAQEAGREVDRAENIATRLDTLAHEAWAAATEGGATHAVQQLVDQAVGSLREWLWKRMIGAAATKLAELCAPAVGEVIAAIQAIYAAVQTFLTYQDTLKGVFATVVGTFADLAEKKGTAVAAGIGRGVIGPQLVKLIVPALDFLAGLFGIGRLTGAIQAALATVRQKIDAVLGKLAAALADAVRGVAGGRGHGGQATPEHSTQQSGSPVTPQDRLAAALAQSGKLLRNPALTKSDVLRYLSGIKQSYGLSDITLHEQRAGVETARVYIGAVINPRGHTETETKELVLWNVSEVSTRQLQEDLDPTPRRGESLALAQARVAAAQAELQRRTQNYIHGTLPATAPGVFISKNDVDFALNGAHTLDHHSPTIPLYRALNAAGQPNGTKTIEGRLFGDPPWPRRENTSTRWDSEDVINTTLHTYLDTHWKTVSRDLATSRLHEHSAVFDAGHRVGQGLANNNAGHPGAAAMPPSVSHPEVTSLVRVTIRLVPHRQGQLFIVTSFPVLRTAVTVD